MKTRRLSLAFFIVAVVAAAGYGAYAWWFAPAATPAWRFATLERGPIVASVSATGTLNPVVTVQVGSQISGQIEEVLADFNSTVQVGQLIARIAPETHAYRVRQTEADLEAARAMVSVQQAELYRAQVNLAGAERDFERKRLLVERNFLSPAELDKARTLLEAARAQQRAVEAQAQNSAALVRQREAQLAQARVDLRRTEIRAPVDGIVVKRSVQPGQTVAASLQAPELFVIAQNLKDMQVETAIDEADVGRLAVGQAASFTVDAFPGQRFAGEVVQVRKAAQVVANVVSYTVVISAANPELILLPGMTANVRIVTAQKDEVLKAPNAALRFRPPAPAGEPGATPERQPRPGGGMGNRAGGTGKLWVAGPGGQPTAIEVRTGLSDGSHTEVVADGIEAGRAVIVGVAAAERPQVTQPRMPRMF